MSPKQRRVGNERFKQMLEGKMFGCLVLVIGIMEYIFGPKHEME